MARVCMQQEFIDKPFTSWIKETNNLYVGRNLRLYLQDRMNDSKWCAEHIFSQH